MSRYDFWTHGVSTFVEDPVPGTVMVHAGYGTLVHQPAGTENWFHIPLPSPTILDSDTEVAVVRVAFRARVNENARIKAVELWRNNEKISGGDPVEWSDEPIYKAWWVGDEWPAGSAAPPRIMHSDGGLSLRFRVAFLDGAVPGEITFQGAGAQFDE